MDKNSLEDDAWPITWKMVSRDPWPEQAAWKMEYPWLSSEFLCSKSGCVNFNWCILLTVATSTIMPFGDSSMDTAKIGASANVYRMALSIKFTSKLISESSSTLAFVRLQWKSSILGIYSIFSIWSKWTNAYTAHFIVVSRHLTSIWSDFGCVDDQHRCNKIRQLSRWLWYLAVCFVLSLSKLSGKHAKTWIFVVCSLNGKT